MVFILQVHAYIPAHHSFTSTVLHLTLGRDMVAELREKVHAKVKVDLLLNLRSIRRKKRLRTQTLPQKNKHTHS